MFRLYATRPAPPGAATTHGSTVAVPVGGHTEHTPLGVYRFAEIALDALWLAHERRDSFAGGTGWYPPVKGLEHELYRATPFGPRRAEPVARITGGTCTLTQALVDELPRGGAARALAGFTATHRLVTGRPPIRTPQLTTLITPGGTLAAEGE